MAGKQSDIRPLRVEPTFRSIRAREPLKFGAVVLEEVTYCLVEAEVENRRGVRAVGHGAIPLSDFWAFPDSRVEHALREQAMMDVCRRFCALASEYTGCAHPIDIYMELEESLGGIGEAVSKERSLPCMLPRLAQLVSVSPVDAALHDAFGIANGISSYDGYGPEFVNYDLSRYLGPGFRGKYISDYIRREYPASLPVFHLVGGLDTLRRKDVKPDAPQDGLPNCLEEWVERDGLTCLKVKLKGTDMDWDLERINEVHAIARAVHQRLGITELHFSVDTNEQCESPQYIVEMLSKLKERNRDAYDRILYVEQPTERDLRKSRHDMSCIAELKPVIIDESLTSLEDFDLAMELNWSGLALKSCKGHSWALIFACRAEEQGIPYAIQDLTNPGISLVHSAGLAGRLHTLMGVEANSPQYFPDANVSASAVHPGIFRRRDGCICLESIQGPGLGLRWDEIPSPRL